MDHNDFLSASGPHVIMVTNHGIHEWNVNAGLPDTGGQNVYVNQLSAALGELGFRVTIYNRGGYPHPVHGSERRGAAYRGPRERIVYLEDGRREFVRKEQMFPQLEPLADDLARELDEGPPPALVISHYWDGAAVAARALEEMGRPCPHVWIPHSLGELKKEGTDPAQWDELRIEERIATEKEILREVDLVGATSGAIEECLEQRYGIEQVVFLPPCVDETRFDRKRVRKDHSAAGLLRRATGLPEGRLLKRRIITEVSRTDRTKRKNILIEAFARIHKEFPESLLAVTIDPAAGELYEELTGLIDRRGLPDHVAVLGSVPEYLPSLYGMSTLYCTPSAVEGFGMSIQEAAACGVPAVASRRVPFAREHLLGENPTHRPVPHHSEDHLEVGEGAVVVPVDDVEATAEGMRLMLTDEELRRHMGDRAYRITIPRFTWRRVTRAFLEHAGVALPAQPSDRHE